LRGPRLVATLVAISVLAAAPGVVWYFLLRPAASAHTQTSEALPPTSETGAVPSIAVLPLVDMSPGKDQEYFADGLAEELLNLLAKVPGLRVHHPHPHSRSNVAGERGPALG
jgi:adenylate cyclase